MMQHYIYGAGGHGKVVLDAMQTQLLSCAGFIDDKGILEWVGLSVSSASQLNFDKEIGLHLAIGSGRVRESIVTQLEAATFFSVYHASTTIAKTSKIGVGTFVAAQSVIAPDAKVGKHCIINHSAVVDHDCVVGDFTHIAPQASLGGGSKVGKGVLIGAGAVLLPEVEVSDYAIVGAGAVVTKNIPVGMLVIGNPARRMN